MTELYTLPRVENWGDLDHQKGVYKAGKYGGVAYSCGDCGTMLIFANEKVVDENGFVTPSMQCPDCGWHVMGILKDWNPSNDGSGQPESSGVW
jgi:DNA-directed RNA polymerase subunit RPC12/RpoP